MTCPMTLLPMATTSDLESCTSDLEAVEARSSLIVLPRRWTSLEAVGRCLFLFSVAFFIVGVLVTVFGFSQLGLEPSQKLPLQVIGPTCLAVTVVMWAVGCLLSRLWHAELSRQKHMMELRDRVQLHALAVDSLLDSPVLSPAILQDPQLRRQLLLKLKAQPQLRNRQTRDSSLDDTFDTHDTYDTRDTFSTQAELLPKGGSIRRQLPDTSISDVRVSPGAYSDLSRRSSKAAILDARRRMSSAQFDTLVQAELERRRSRDGAGSAYMGGGGRHFQLPGIQISRFETLDRASITSAAATSQRSSRRYVLLHSGTANGNGMGGGGSNLGSTMGGLQTSGGDLARLSCPSDYSLSRSSRSRSSRASSAISSRLWDFSPRSSEWDADVSLGSRESQLSVMKQDWAGGPADCLGDDDDATRKLSVVTFDIGSPSFRRHSSPTYPLRRRESVTSECTCQRLAQQPYQKRYSADIRVPPTSIMKKYSVDQSIRSLRIDEDDGDIEEEDEEDDDDNDQADNTASCAVKQHSSPSEPLLSTPQHRLVLGPPKDARDEEAFRRESSISAPPTIDDRATQERRDRLRRSFKRNNTDDSEVERRVARLFREIELSLNESTDDSCCRVHGATCGGGDQDVQFCPRLYETREVETQTCVGAEGPSGSGGAALLTPPPGRGFVERGTGGSISSLGSSGSDTQSDFTYSNSSVGGYRPLDPAARARVAAARSKWSRFTAFARALVSMKSTTQRERRAAVTMTVASPSVLTTTSTVAQSSCASYQFDRRQVSRKSALKPN